LWSAVAVIWLGETKSLDGRLAAAMTLLFVYVIVLSGSRTGALGTLTLAGWGLLDKRLSRRARIVLVAAPLFYLATWWLTGAWFEHAQRVFAQGRLAAPGENYSSNRFAIWSNALALIASHPWLGVGFGDFNFAWTLTPFPGRPTEFFDHSHNLVLNFAVEMGIPLAVVALALLVFALWRALRNAIAEGRAPDDDAPFPIQRAAFVIVFLVAVHSMLEYPLWYSYFLLPAAFAFGLCLERPVAADVALADAAETDVTRPLVLAAMVLMLTGTLAVYDYMRVVVIFMPTEARSLERRIAEGRESVLFGHHADYAAATIAEHPGKVMIAFRRAPHYLLDTRLMAAWARAFAERGEVEKARWIADRLREFRSEEAEEFFAPCRSAQAAGTLRAATSPAVAASAAQPFQCRHATQTFRFEDFR